MENGFTEKWRRESVFAEFPQCVLPCRIFSSNQLREKFFSKTVNFTQFFQKTRLKDPLCTRINHQTLIMDRNPDTWKGTEIRTFGSGQKSGHIRTKGHFTTMSGTSNQRVPRYATSHKPSSEHTQARHLAKFEQNWWQEF